MDKMFSSFVVNETVVKQIKALPMELQLKFSMALFDYGLYGIEPELTGLESVVWIGIKDFIDFVNNEIVSGNCEKCHKEWHKTYGRGK